MIRLLRVAVTPQSLNRRLPSLGLLLMGMGGLGFYPPLWMDSPDERRGSIFFVYYAPTFLILLLGAMMVCAGRLQSQGLCWASWVVFLVWQSTELGVFFLRVGFSSFLQTLFLLEQAVSAALTLALPLLWGSALARINDPDPATGGRLAAVAAWIMVPALALVFLLSASESVMVHFMKFSTFMPWTYHLSSATFGIARVCLLAACIETLRPMRDPGAAGLRLRRVRRAILAWFLLDSLTWILLGIARTPEDRIPLLWKYLIGSALLGSCTLLVSRVLEKPPPGFDSASKIHP